MSTFYGEYPPGGGGGGGGGSTVSAAKTVAISSSATSVSTTYTTAFTNTSYALVVSMNNTTDASPQFQPVVITAKSKTGFTVKWNAPTDSANYNLEYVAVPYV